MSAATTATDSGRSPAGSARWLRTAAAVRAARSAATSAVSTGWTRLPTAKTPGAEVQDAVDSGAARAPVEVQAAGSRELVVRHPVAGEDHGVALEASCRTVGAEQLDPRDPATPHDPAHGGVGDDARTPPERGPGTEPLVGLGARLVGHERDDLDPGVRERHQGRVAHVLGPDDDGPPAHRQAVEVDGLLELPGGEDTRRPVTGHPAGGAGTLPGSGGQRRPRGRSAARVPRGSWSPATAAHPNP